MCTQLRVTDRSAAAPDGFADTDHPGGARGTRQSSFTRAQDMGSVDEDEGPEEDDHDDIRSTSPDEATIDINDTVFEEIADDATRENAGRDEVRDGFDLLTPAHDHFQNDGGTASFDNALETDPSLSEEDRDSDSSSSEDSRSRTGHLILVQPFIVLLCHGTRAKTRTAIKMV